MPRIRNDSDTLLTIGAVRVGPGREAEVDPAALQAWLGTDEGARAARTDKVAVRHTPEPEPEPEPEPAPPPVAPQPKPKPPAAKK